MEGLAHARSADDTMSLEKLVFNQYHIAYTPDGNPIILTMDGVGITYRANDVTRDSGVILRVFSEDLLGDENAQGAFVKRARTLIDLDHDHITRIIDTGQHANSFFYVLQDSGAPTLKEHVEANGPIGINTALHLCLQLTDALSAVRGQAGLLTRLWPKNLMILPPSGSDPVPTVQIMAVDLIPGVPPLDSPQYLAPEVLRGVQDSTTSALYSIGASLYFMLTGLPPYEFRGSVKDLLLLQDATDPDFSNIPAAAASELIFKLLQRLLHKSPMQRYQSIWELRKGLENCIRFTPGTGTRRIPLPDPEEISRISKGEGKIKPPAPRDEPIIPPVPRAMTPPPGGQTESAPRNEASENTSSHYLQTELSKAQAHTQRLSLELTRRVQKELELTKQLKAVEARLEEALTGEMGLTDAESAPSGIPAAAEPTLELETEAEFENANNLPEESQTPAPWSHASPEQPPTVERLRPPAGIISSAETGGEKEAYKPLELAPVDPPKPSHTTFWVWLLTIALTIAAAVLAYPYLKEAFDSELAPVEIDLTSPGFINDAPVAEEVEAPIEEPVVPTPEAPRPINEESDESLPPIEVPEAIETPSPKPIDESPGIVQVDPDGFVDVDPNPTLAVPVSEEPARDEAGDVTPAATLATLRMKDQLDLGDWTGLRKSFESFRKTAPEDYDGRRGSLLDKINIMATNQPKLLRNEAFMGLRRSLKE